LFLALMAVIAALSRRWRIVVAASPLLLFTVGAELCKYLPRGRVVVEGETIRVMTANLLHANRRPGPLAAEIAGADADVILLQEYTFEWHERLRPVLAETHAHSRYVRREDSFGIAIYSRRPFVGHVDVQVPLGEPDMVPQARAVIEIAGRLVAFYNVHLLPARTLEYTIEQRHQFGDLLRLLTAEEVPVVLCGDFNFTEASAFADALRRRGLVDAHEPGGGGRGATWPVMSFFRALPGIRLDHVYLSEELTSTAARTGVGTGSDHRPVVAEVGFEPRAAAAE
jgi:endonuclease/exonuclease/phosphatase (EEP) superfamily protein YafD